MTTSRARAGRQRAERRRIGVQVVTEVVVGAAQRDRRGGLARALRGAPGGVAAGPAGNPTRSRDPRPGRHRRGQLGPAVRAEPGPVGIRPAAPGAVDPWHGSARPPLVVLIVFERSSPRYARGGGAVHAPREQPAPSAPAIFFATLPPHRLLTSAVHPRHALLPARPVAGPAPAGGDRRANRNARIVSHSRIPRGWRLSHHRVRDTAYPSADRISGDLTAVSRTLGGNRQPRASARPAPPPPPTRRAAAAAVVGVGPFGPQVRDGLGRVGQHQHPAAVLARPRARRRWCRSRGRPRPPRPRA